MPRSAKKRKLKSRPGVTPHDAPLAPAAPAASGLRGVVFVELSRDGVGRWRGEYLCLGDDGAVTGLGLGDAPDVRVRLDRDVPAGLIATLHPGPVRDALGPARQSDVLDLTELARVVRPDMAGFEEGDLAALAGDAADVPTGGAGLTARVWHALWARLVSLPLAVLTECMWLTQMARPALSEVLLRAEAAVRADPAADTKALDLLFKDNSDKLRALRDGRELGPPSPLAEDEVEKTLGCGGAVAAGLDTYEDRPQQRRMAQAVARAFSTGRHLMAEGGTGVGKSLAYLVPAVLWATRNGRPVVVSTHTKNLQSQLFEKDLPLLRRSLGADFRAAVIKGRRNYLCLRKLIQLLRSAEYELDLGERTLVASILVWAIRTGTGDLAEHVPLQSEPNAALIDKLTSPGFECPGWRCPRHGVCFLQSMRADAVDAHVVIANHALVFAELGAAGSVLPPHGEVVFDEAHHVEAVATEHLGVSAARLEVMHALARLFRTVRHGPATGSGSGLLATAFHEIAQAESSLEGEFASKAHEATRRASEQVRVVSDAADSFFAASSELLAAGSGERRQRYRNTGRDSPAWQRVFELGGGLTEALNEQAERVDGVVKLLESEEARPIEHRSDLAADLATQACQLKEAVANVRTVLDAESEDRVYWVEDDPSAARTGPFARFAAAPIEVAPLLKAVLLDLKRSCVFTSATLTVGDRFEYLSGRLGLDVSSAEHPARVDTIAVGSPFDYQNQVRVYLPDYLPDPRETARFTAELSELCIELFAASRGRGMVLFTSYAMLSLSREVMAPALAAHEIRILAQGRDGSRESLLEELKAGNRVVLLGTASFWEGIDVPGEALSVLVVAKLPFHVFTDPVIEARCEAIRDAGEDPFTAYTVPAAVLRLRQGFGRLIRSSSDRGVVVIADPRLTRARYGQTFLESLPVRAQRARDAGSLVRAAKRFLETPNAEP